MPVQPRTERESGWEVSGEPPLRRGRHPNRDKLAVALIVVVLAAVIVVLL